MLSEDLKQALSERWRWDPPKNLKQSFRVLDTEVKELTVSVNFMEKGVAADNHLNAKAGANSALRSADKIRAILKLIA